jgi:hypothetical protein
MAAPAGHEVPHGALAHRLVRRHHRVLVPTIVGLEEIELKALLELAGDVLAEDDDPLGPLPLVDPMPHGEGLEAGGDPLPALALRHHLADAEPVPLRDPHGVLDARGRETLEYGLLTERPIEPGLEGNRPQRLSGAREDLLEIPDGIDRVVDVSRPVPYAEDLPGLREVARQRVVGAVLRVMGIESPFSAIDLVARADDGAVEVERGAPQLAGREGRVGDLAQQRVQALAKARHDAREPTRECALVRHALEPGKAKEERIARHHASVAQTAPSHQEKPYDQQRHAPGPVVGVETAVREDLPQPIDESRAPQEAPEQLETGVGRQRLGRESDLQIALDAGSQRAFP